MSRLLCDTTLRYSVGQKGIEGFAGQLYAGKLHVRFDEGVGVPHGGFVATSQFPTYSSGGGQAQRVSDDQTSIRLCMMARMRI